jgi:hypothetical protein
LQIFAGVRAPVPVATAIPRLARIVVKVILQCTNGGSYTRIAQIIKTATFRAKIIYCAFDSLFAALFLKVVYVVIALLAPRGNFFLKQIIIPR